jgi:four helix bundle protein
MPFRFEGLEIWHLARVYINLIYKVTARFPRSEQFGLASQMNRAAHSITLNIAEGSGLDTNRQFDHRLGIAMGELFEVVSGSFQALDRNYVDQDIHARVYEEGDKLARKINSFRRTLR